jgi:hypothetical protein
MWFGTTYFIVYNKHIGLVLWSVFICACMYMCTEMLGCPGGACGQQQLSLPRSRQMRRGMKIDLGDLTDSLQVR